MILVTLTFRNHHDKEILIYSDNHMPSTVQLVIIIRTLVIS